MIIFSLCCLVFINAMSIGLVFPIFAPLFTQATAPLFAPGTSLNIQSLFYTLILAVPTIFMLFGAPFLGRLSDRFGRKKVLLFGLIGVATSFSISTIGILYGSLLLLFISRALAGFMDGSEAVAQAAIADLSAANEKARVMGYATFAGTLGFIIGPVLGGFLAEPRLTGHYHYEIPFVISLIATLLNAVMLYFFYPKKTFEKPIVMEKINYFHLLGKSFLICFDKRISGFSFLLFTLQWCLAAFFQLSTLVLVEKFHYSSGQVGLFTTFIGICFSAGIFIVIHLLLERVQHSLLLRFGISLIAASLISALYFHNSSLFAWVSVAPLMIGIAMMYNVLLAFISNAVTVDEQGDAMGSGNSLKALGWLSSGVLVGWLYPNVIAILVVMLIVVLFAFFSTRWLKV